MSGLSYFKIGPRHLTPAWEAWIGQGSKSYTIGFARTTDNIRFVPYGSRQNVIFEAEVADTFIAAVELLALTYRESAIDREQLAGL